MMDSLSYVRAEKGGMKVILEKKTDGGGEDDD
jgi:hypothetical protein